ncbi:MAG: DUF1552 domain-containing protein [Verrucomicrobiales bacterium]
MSLNPVFRRQFLRDLGLSASALPFVAGLPGLRAVEGSAPAAKRLIIMFSPNGTLPGEFWPKAFGDGKPLELGSMLAPLEPFKKKMLILKGVHNRVGGDGDQHMRGISCLLTGCELNPGNIQGGSHNPAGWARGISIDQEIKNFFQSQDSTSTRFGSLEFGVAVPNRADPWTRMSYAGNNKPIAPIDDPVQMFEKLYGGVKERDNLASVLDDLLDDLKRVSKKLSSEDRLLLAEHMQLVRELELELASAKKDNSLAHPQPEIDPDIEIVNDNTPQVSRMQIDMLVNAMANDMTRVATLQFMRSVGQARMRWLGIEDGHHTLSHKPDGDKVAAKKLWKINHWFAGELAYLAKRLKETPEPGGMNGSMLDNTQIVWLNELGKGNSHTLQNIPFLLLGGGCGFKTGRALDFKGKAHNSLWLSIAHGVGHGIKTFGKAQFCQDGALPLS